MQGSEIAFIPSYLSLAQQLFLQGMGFHSDKSLQHPFAPKSLRTRYWTTNFLKTKYGNIFLKFNTFISYLSADLSAKGIHGLED